MTTRQTFAAGVVGTLMAVSPLLAHHEWPVERTTRITIQGTVTAFTWANPHVMIALDVEANGTVEQWCTTVLQRRRNALLRPGDTSTGGTRRLYADQPYCADWSNVMSNRAPA